MLLIARSLEQMFVVKRNLLPYERIILNRTSNVCNQMYSTLSSNVFVSCNNKATVTRHNYSRWRRPGNLKTKTSDSEIHFFRIQTLSSKKGQPVLIVNIMFFGSRLYFRFRVGSLLESILVHTRFVLEVCFVFFLKNKHCYEACSV